MFKKGAVEAVVALGGVFIGALSNVYLKDKIEYKLKGHRKHHNRGYNDQKLKKGTRLIIEE